MPVRHDLFGVCGEYTACVDFLRTLSRDKGLNNWTHLPWRLVLVGFLNFKLPKARFRKLSSRFRKNCLFQKMSSWEKFWRWGRASQMRKQDKERSIKSSTARWWSKIRSLVDSSSNSILALYWNVIMTKMVRLNEYRREISRLTFELQLRTSLPQSTSDQALLHH